MMLVERRDQQNAADAAALAGARYVLTEGQGGGRGPPDREHERVRRRGSE